MDKVDAFGRPTERHGRCASDDTGLAFALIIVTLNILLLAYGNLLVYQSRHVPTKYNEGKYIAFCVANNLQVAFAVLDAPLASLALHLTPTPTGKPNPSKHA